MASRSFTDGWLAGEPGALSLLPRAFSDAAARADAVSRASTRRVHPAVLASMAPISDAQRDNHAALGRPGTTVAVTGQQAGLFGGPLYSVYKAATAIVVAARLQEETGTRCVPVFWLQDEDHDYEEIASSRVLGADGRLHRLEASAGGDPGASIAHRVYDGTVRDAVDQLAEILSGLSGRDAVVDEIRGAWREGLSPAAAFARWIAARFAPMGLLVLDPCHPGLAEAARPVHARAIAEAAAISAALQQRSRGIAAAGFRVQVHVRPGSPLSFLHPDGADGPRFRLDPDPEGFRVVGSDRVVATADGIHSTSALLRPVLQDTWLPTAAYVGGPGEIAYFAQLPPVYDAFGLSMPLVVPRARFRVVDAVSDRLSAKLGLQAEVLGEPRGDLLTRIGSAGGDGPDPSALLSACLDPLNAALDDFVTHAEALDGLAKATTKTRASVTSAIERLTQRYQRARASADADQLDRLDRLCARLQPDGVAQERVHAWPYYGARYGSAFVDAVIAGIEPFDGTLRELRP